MLTFEPKKEEELSSFKVVEPGIYAAEVIKCEDKISKAGNVYFQLSLVFYDKVGIKIYQRDSLIPSFPKKLKHFCDHAGLDEHYHNGTLLVKDCENKRVGMVLGIKEETTDLDTGKVYPRQNEVLDYVALPSGADIANREQKFDDDIPF